MTYERAAAKTLAYFEVEHQKRRKAETRTMCAEARSGNLWVLGVLHARALGGDPFASEALNNSPDLVAELVAPR
jgi:hypothetical protein